MERGVHTVIFEGTAPDDEWTFPSQQLNCVNANEVFIKMVSPSLSLGSIAPTPHALPPIITTFMLSHFCVGYSFLPTTVQEQLKSISATHLSPYMNASTMCSVEFTSYQGKRQVL